MPDKGPCGGRGGASVERHTTAKETVPFTARIVYGEAVWLNNISKSLRQKALGVQPLVTLHTQEPSRTNSSCAHYADIRCYYTLLVTLKEEGLRGRNGGAQLWNQRLLNTFLAGRASSTRRVQTHRLRVFDYAF